MSDEALALRRLSKTFGGQQALREVDFTVRAGEVHGLLGQNGSGKSTLIKVLAGFHRPDPGARLRILGAAVPLPIPPGRFRHYRISFVHQNLGLVSALTVLENLLIARFATTDRWRVDWPREADAARATFSRYGLEIDPLVAVSRLSSVERALIAIVRAVEEAGEGAGVLVLDEPTPFLPRRDVERLFVLIRRLAARGTAVVFVSHDIDEVLEITDRVTVLRDGMVVGGVETAETSRDEIVQMIVGRALEPTVPRPPPAAGPPAVEVRDLVGGQLDGMSLTARSGEILGVTGLLGSGYEEMPYLLYGALAATAGELSLAGRVFDLRRLNPSTALAAGMVLIPADRPVAGGVPALPIADNLALPALGSRFAPWRLRRSEILDHARRLGETFRIVPNRPQLPLSALSGGNQQKVVLAKWLQLDPTLMLLDEPTQGVDVGARRTIFRAIRDAAERGAAIICASSDADQLAELCDRVVVLAHGRIAAEIVPPALNKHAIVAACYGGTA